MSNDRDIVYAFLGTGYGIWWFFKGFNLFRKKQLMDDIPTSTVRGLAMGLVELSGRARRDVILRGPLSQEECVAYAYEVERYQSSGKSSHWVTIAGGNSFACSFFVEDDTGRVLVAPMGAEFIIRTGYSFTTGFGKSLPPALVDFMTRAGLSYRGFMGQYTLRFTEKNIKPCENVFVLGTARKQNPDAQNSGAYRERLAKRLEDLKNDPKFMTSVDTNQDGNLSDEEWRAAAMKVEHDLLSGELTAEHAGELEDVVVAKGETEKTFIISDESQKQLDNSFGWRIIAGIFGGSALTIFCLGYLLFRFKIF